MPNIYGETSSKEIVPIPIDGISYFHLAAENGWVIEPPPRWQCSLIFKYPV